MNNEEIRRLREEREADSDWVDRHPGIVYGLVGAILIALVAFLVLMAVEDAEAASLAPKPVSQAVSSYAHQIADTASPVEGVAGQSYSGLGLLGICAKKRHRPYGCEIRVSTQMMTRGTTDWVHTKIDCTVWVLSTRAGTLWAPDELFGCPQEWKP